MIGDIVLDIRRIGSGLRHVARETLRAKENIVAPVSRGIGFGKDLASCAIPVVRSSRFLDSPAIGIVNIGDSASTDDAIFGIVKECATCAVIDDISRGIIGQAAQMVVAICHFHHVLTGRTAGVLLQQIAPGIVHVAIRPMTVVSSRQ